MRFFSFAFSASVICAALVAAADHTVQVGPNGTLTFNPTSVTVLEGDTVSFLFNGKNHSVTQSTFATPCAPINLTTPGVQGVDSNFVPVEANATTLPQWTFTVTNASAPLWFYCAQTSPKSHCSAGMVFAINPTENKTFDAFQNKATGGSNSTTGSNGTSTASTGKPSTTANGANTSFTISLGAITAMAISLGLLL